jgi:hypothetical protein
MKLSNFAFAVLLGAASIGASAADNSTSDRSASLSSANTITKDHHGYDVFRIVKPYLGEGVNDTTTVKAVLRVGDGILPESLRVKLNGKNVTSHFQRGECEKNACKWTAELTKANRLLTGQNQLIALARNSRRNIELARLTFSYSPGVTSGASYYTPDAVGISLNAGGAQPWVSLTTGTPANLQDNLNGDGVQFPYRDATFPAATDTPCNSRYQVVVLNRQTPAQEDNYMCPADAAALKSDLAGLTKGTEIVLVGTTQNNTADAGLDTTAIGGTNYSSYPASWQPQGYAAIGVPGAAPGSAYESYYLASDVGKSYQQNPFATGLLSLDSNSNYNFHAANNLQFEAYPNNPNLSTSTFTVNYYGASTLQMLPPAGSTNGIWLLVLDRVTLQPIDYADQGPCSGASFFCGQFFPTGSADSTVASQALTDLTQALELPTSRQLVVLMTVGQPFQSASVASGMVSPMSWYGGAGYRMEALTTSTSTYTLVSPGRLDWTGTWPPSIKSPFATGVVNSSSVFSLGQGNENRQTGIVRGVMARDNNSLYFPTVVSQEDGKDNGSGATSLSIDYDFYSISTQMPIDWPLTDTSGHIAAYHYVSQKFLANHNNETGPNAYDVRYFYPGSPWLGNYNTDFLCAQFPNIANCVYPSGDNPGFTEQDLADANAELYLELTALNTSNSYLGNTTDRNGLYGLMLEGSTPGTSVSDLVIDATYEVLNGQVGAVPSTNVGANSFDWMNLLAGLTSIGAAALGPADVPMVAAAVGVTSGALWTGSAMDPWWQGSDYTPPSYENTFDTTLGNLEQSAAVYAANMATGYGTALNNIYSDWGRLQATGAKTSNTATGWYFSNQLSAEGIAAPMAAGVRRSMYLQLVPQFFSADTYIQQPVSNLDQIGMFESIPFGEYKKIFSNSCYNSYRTGTLSNPFAFSTFVSPSGPTEYDFFVLGGTINNQNTPNVNETMPSDLLLNTLFAAPSGTETPGTGPLDIPQELVYGTAALPDRSGPSLGNYDGITQCYKPGCSDQTLDPTKSSCINP